MPDNRAADRPPDLRPMSCCDSVSAGLEICRVLPPAEETARGNGGPSVGQVADLPWSLAGLCTRITTTVFYLVRQGSPDTLAHMSTWAWFKPGSHPRRTALLSRPVRLGRLRRAVLRGCDPKPTRFEPCQHMTRWRYATSQPGKGYNAESCAHDLQPWTPDWQMSRGPHVNRGVWPALNIRQSGREIS
jgi:hypothetical protein